MHRPECASEKEYVIIINFLIALFNIYIIYNYYSLRPRERADTQELVKEEVQLKLV